NTIFKRSAIAVCAAVAERRQKRVKQVAMRRVDLDQLGAGISGASRCGLECFHDGGDLSGVQLSRHLVTLFGIEGDRARRPDGSPASLRRRERLAAFPGSVGAGFASRVGQLYSWNGALLPDEGKDRLQCFSVGIAP